MDLIVIALALAVFFCTVYAWRESFAALRSSRDAREASERFLDELRKQTERITRVADGGYTLNVGALVTALTIEHGSCDGGRCRICALLDDQGGQNADPKER